MAKKQKYPITQAIRYLRKEKVDYTPFLHVYEEHGGTAVSAREIGVEEHCVIKTLVMQDETNSPLIILMHGDCSVSTKELARAIGSKQVTPCTPETAEKHSGYRVGGTSPFGTRKALPIYIEESILALEKMYINGGHRGFILEMEPAVLQRLLEPTPVHVAI